MASEQMRSNASMHKYHSEENLRVGECVVHKRLLEAYCVKCHVLICPTCLMFGEHKNHEVDQMDAAAKGLREAMDFAAKEGILKLEKTETVLVDIRHTKLNFESALQNVLKEIEATFSQIFKLIKQRKDEIVSSVQQHYKQQFENIDLQEKAWQDKQQRAYAVIGLAKQQNDYQLLEKATYIHESLEILRQQPTYKNVYMVTTIDSTFSVNNITLNLPEFQKHLASWIKLGEQALIQFKC